MTLDEIFAGQTSTGQSSSLDQIFGTSPKIQALSSASQVARANATHVASIGGILGNVLSPLNDYLGNAYQSGIQGLKTQFQDFTKNPVQSVINAGKAAGSAILEAGTNAGKAVQEATNAFGNPETPTAELVAKSLNVPLSLVGIALAPVAAASAAAEKLPFLKQANDILNAGFNLAGKPGAFVADKFVNALPISEESKTTLRPTLENIGSLAGQIYLGGKVIESLGHGDEITKDKIGSLADEAKRLPVENQTPIEQKVPLNKIFLTPKDLTPNETGINVETPHIPENQLPIIDYGKSAKVKSDLPKLQPLAQEAQKYKSAEEFVKAQTNAQHGTSADFAEFKKVDPSKGEAIYLSDKGQAKASAIASRNGKLMDVAIDESRVKTFNPQNPTPEINSIVQDAIDKVHGKGKYRYDPEAPVETRNIINKVDDVLQTEVIKQASKLGYNDFRFYEPSTHEYSRAITDNSLIKTKSQLTDFYNQATKKTTELKPIESTGPVVRSKLAQDVAKAIEVKGQELANLPEYNRVNMAEQAQFATDLLEKHPERALRVALGEELPPTHILPEMIFNAVEEKAKLEGDVETLRRLATESNLSLQATAMGQRIRALAERDQNSPVKYIQDVKEARESTIEKKTGLEKAKNNIVNEIKSEVIKSTKRPDWEQFIKDIQCGY